MNSLQSCLSLRSKHELIRADHTQLDSKLTIKLNMAKSYALLALHLNLVIYRLKIYLLR